MWIHHLTGVADNVYLNGFNFGGFGLSAWYMDEAVVVCGNGGYPIAQYLTDEYRKKIHQKINRLGYVDRRH